MQFIKSFAFVSIVMTFNIGISAQEMHEYGISEESFEEIKALKVGSVAPNFEGTDQFNNVVSLREELEETSIILIFYRGNWCGICQKNLAELQEQYASILSSEVKVIAVAPEVEEYRNKTVSDNNLAFSVITDPDNKIMESYGVAFKVNDVYNQKVIEYKGLSLNEFNGQDEAVLPIPATYLIGQNGEIKYAHFDPNYRNRASLEEILSHL